MTTPKGVIAAVAAGSLGERAGLQPGDRLLAINDQILRDVIDVQFYGAEELLDLAVEREGRQFWIEVERDYGEPLGLDFAHPTFDEEIRRCANNCDFCFVKQNARGMRRSLYVKDDDYRYSFLLGNFVTLTNLTGEDWARLEEQRLSPLYVSVHATDLALRRRFLAHSSAPDVMDQLRRLARLGIEVHTQVVLVPGLNDGPHLERTLQDLTGLFQAPVASIGVVPIGLTRFHRGGYRTFTPDESRGVLDQLDRWRQSSQEHLGCAFAHASDEWYLVAKREVPPAAAYDGFPQVENGVGMVRQLLDGWQTLRSKGSLLSARSATLVCGALIAPVLAQLVAEARALTGADLRLVPVINRFFGPLTTVSGLLAGQDVVAALRGRALGDLVVLPRAMFTGSYGAGSAPPGTTLDDMSIEELSEASGSPVAMASNMADLLQALV